MNIYQDKKELLKPLTKVQTNLNFKKLQTIKLNLGHGDSNIFLCNH